MIVLWAAVAVAVVLGAVLIALKILSVADLVGELDEQQARDNSRPLGNATLLPRRKP